MRGINRHNQYERDFLGQIEYDTVTDAYPRFLDEEVLPFFEDVLASPFGYC